jgi:molybdopterin-guanine dinucleotide biosynthesis protein A
MLHHAVGSLGRLCREVIVVISPDAPEPSVPAGIAVRFARDAVEGEGPLAGVSAGLDAVGATIAFVVAGDMPELQDAVLGEMLRVASDTDAEAVALRDGGRVPPAPCVLRVDPAARLAGALLASGHRRLRDLLDAMRVEVVEERTWRALDPDGRTLRDVDEPRDLEA